MKHKWEIVITEYYDMDSDFVCQKCGVRGPREFPRKVSGGFRDTRETIEEFEARMQSPSESWRNISIECNKSE